MVAWNTALLHADLVAAVVGMSVFAVPRPQVPPTQVLRKTFGDNFFYMLYFQEPGHADAELDGDPARTMRRMFGGPRPPDDTAGQRMLRPGPEGFIDRIPEPTGLPDWITQAEFTRTGFTGGLNWYRNIDRNWHRTESLCTATVTAPAMFIAGSADGALRSMRTDRVSEVISGPYREVNAALLDFLKGLELT